MSTTESSPVELPILLLIDESAAMARPWGRDPRSRAEGLASLVNGFLARLRRDPAVLVALIGYATDATGRAEATSRWGGALAGKDFVPVPDVHAAPLSTHSRIVRDLGKDAAAPERVEQVPVWYVPRSIGEGRPQCEAFRICGERLEALAASVRRLSAPVIVHIATGDSTDGDPARMLERIGLLSGAERSTVVHVHTASSRMAVPIAYPQAPAGPPPAEAKALWSLASPLGEGWVAAAERAKIAAGASPASLGIIVHSGVAEVLKLLKVVEALAESIPTVPEPRSQAAEVRPEMPAAAPVGVSPIRDATAPVAVPRGLGESRVAWTFPPRAARSTLRRSLRNSAVVDRQGRLLVCLQDRLVALTAEGAGLWSYATGGHIPGSPALGLDGLTRVHSTDGFLHIVASDGSRAGPPVEVGPPLGRASPVVDQDGTTWISAATGGVLRIESGCRSAVTRPYYDSGCQLNSMALIRDGVLYVGGEDDNLHAINLSAATGRNSWDDEAGRGRTGWYINAAPAPAPGPLVIVPSFDEHLYAFRLDGTIAWNARLPGPARGSCVVDRAGRIYLGSGRSRSRRTEAGVLLAIDAETASVVPLVATDEPIESTPVIGDDNVIYFGDNAGFVHACDLTGQPLWRADVGSPVRSAGVIAAPGVVVFGLDDGTLAALRCSSQGPARGGWPQSVGGLGLLARGDDVAPAAPLAPGSSPTVIGETAE